VAAQAEEAEEAENEVPPTVDERQNPILSESD
jgi:hypothetical protein